MVRNNVGLMERPSEIMIVTGQRSLVCHLLRALVGGTLISLDALGVIAVLFDLS